MIKVKDENNHAPVFDQTMYFVSVSEQLATDQVFFRFHAVDHDSGQNAEIKYRLIYDYGSTKFHLGNCRPYDFFSGNSVFNLR